MIFFSLQLSFCDEILLLSKDLLELALILPYKIIAVFLQTIKLNEALKVL